MAANVTRWLDSIAEAANELRKRADGIAADDHAQLRRIDAELWSLIDDLDEEATSHTERAEWRLPASGRGKWHLWTPSRGVLCNASAPMPVPDFPRHHSLAEVAQGADLIPFTCRPCVASA